jgi:hypothetical protein
MVACLRMGRLDVVRFPEGWLFYHVVYNGFQSRKIPFLTFEIIFFLSLFSFGKGIFAVDFSA